VPRRRGTAAVARQGLRDAGIDSVHAYDVALGGKSDPEVLAKAILDGRTLITRDLGFTDPRRYPPEGHPGIVIVRFPETIKKASLIRMVVDAVRTIQDDDLAKNVVILEPTNVRFWRKPSP